MAHQQMDWGFVCSTFSNVAMTFESLDKMSEINKFVQFCSLVSKTFIRKSKEEKKKHDFTRATAAGFCQSCAIVELLLQSSCNSFTKHQLIKRWSSVLLPCSVFTPAFQSQVFTTAGRKKDRLIY